jgi:hypothetical protein
MSAFKKVESLVSSSPSMANDISELMAELKG